MMRALMLRELKDVGPLVVLAWPFAWVAVMAIGFEPSYRTRPFNSPVALLALLAAYGAAASVFMASIFPRPPGDSGQFSMLLHRPGGFRRVVGARLAMHIAVYTILGAGALVGGGLWAMVPGRCEYPFYWGLFARAAVAVPGTVAAGMTTYAVALSRATLAGRVFAVCGACYWPVFLYRVSYYSCPAAWALALVTIVLAVRSAMLAAPRRDY